MAMEMMAIVVIMMMLLLLPATDDVMVAMVSIVRKKAKRNGGEGVFGSTIRFGHFARCFKMHCAKVATGNSKGTEQRI